MVRLRKVQRNPNLISKRGAPAPQRTFTLLNCLACLCVILNVFVLGLSFLIKRRSAAESTNSQPNTDTNPGIDNKSVTNNAAVIPGAEASANLRGNPDTITRNEVIPIAGGMKYHFVLQSDCKDPTQDWQVYTFFYYMFKSKQEGDVTSIVTGCSPGVRQGELESFFREQIEPMGSAGDGSPSRFHIHFAPAHRDQVSVGGLRTHMKYFNRPFGIMHWMETQLRYVNGHKGPNPHDDTVIVVMDRDMLLLKPFGPTMKNEEELWKATANPPTRVNHGVSFAQYAPFASNWWLDISVSDFAYEVQDAVARLQKMGIVEVNLHYAAGPPFFSTAKDFYPLVSQWTELTFPLYQTLNEKVLREPHAAYALASAILKQPHELASTFSVDNCRDEGFGRFAAAFQAGAPQGGGTGAFCRSFPLNLMPHIAEYSKRYSLGNYIIGKHYVDLDFLGKPESCFRPLFAEPPDNVAEMFSYYKDPEAGTRVTIEHENTVYQMAFLLCETIKALNEAATYYKQKNCKAGMNLEKTKTFD
jgi:hypothetical protein